MPKRRLSDYIEQNKEAARKKKAPVSPGLKLCYLLM
jgi:hypothetical protein